MTRGLALALSTAALVTVGAFGFGSATSAQTVLAAQQQKQAPAARSAPARSAPAIRSAPAARPAPVFRPSITNRTPTFRAAPITPRSSTTVVTPRSPSINLQRNTPTVTPNVVAPRRIGPQFTPPAGIQARSNAIRFANRATISGRNFSVWRGNYRVRRGNYWRTFVALSALYPIFYGFGYYYPYAYVDAPYDYCQGWTEDGCQLQWQSVPTLEGPPEFQCVAYCPWQ